MALLEILDYTKPELRAQTEELNEITPEIRTLIADMAETMEKARGVGLAAPQIGRLIRLFVYDVGDGPHAVINPRVLRATGEEVGTGGCLSIPRLQGDVARARKVAVSWTDERGKRHKKTVEDFTARVFQHEIDHLHGVLFTDKAVPGSLRPTDPPEAENAGESAG
jgi:peptide deformylase